MKPIINFFLPVFKLFGYLILTVIVYTTIEGLYSEQETNTSKQIELKEAHYNDDDNDLENEAVQLL